MTTDETDLVTRDEEGGQLLKLEEELTAALVEAPDAENTRQAYASDQRIYAAWCAGRGVRPLTTTAGLVGQPDAHR